MLYNEARGDENFIVRDETLLLPRDVSGHELVDILREASSALGWDFKNDTKDLIRDHTWLNDFLRQNQLGFEDLLTELAIDLSELPLALRLFYSTPDQGDRYDGLSPEEKEEMDKHHPMFHRFLAYRECNYVSYIALPHENWTSQSWDEFPDSMEIYYPDISLKRTYTHLQLTTKVRGVYTKNVQLIKDGDTMGWVDANLQFKPHRDALKAKILGTTADKPSS